MSFSNLIQRKVGKDSNIQEYLDYILASGKQLHTLIEDINKFQGLEQLDYDFETLELASVVDMVKTGLSSFIAERNASFHIEALPEIRSVQSVLFIILKNLIENGIKYNQSAVPRIEISYEEQAEAHHVFIKDNGIGIAADYFDQVFVMFKRLHNKSFYQGSGIGLALSQKAAHRINAEIKVWKSAPGEGTTFLLAIQKREEQEAGVGANTPESAELAVAIES